WRWRFRFLETWREPFWKNLIRYLALNKLRRSDYRFDLATDLAGYDLGDGARQGQGVPAAAGGELPGARAAAGRRDRDAGCQARGAGRVQGGAHRRRGRQLPAVAGGPGRPGR